MLDATSASRWTTLVAGAAAFATTVVLMISSAAPASALTTGYHQFCYGAYLPGLNSICDSLNHDGQAGYVTEVDGSGVNHSVCVRAQANQGIEMCSGGPNQGVYNSTPPAIYATAAQIRNNASGPNTVYAAATYCVTPGC
jgi:hypothetical protein